MHDTATDALPKGRLTVTVLDDVVAVIKTHVIALDEAATTRVTVPKKPFTPLTLIMGCPVPPTGTD